MKKISFESTYEELKHNIVNRVEEGIGRFESTYEELKLKIISGNFKVRVMFWVYLWGIETKRIPMGPAPETLFWVYLWGIETSV